MWLFWLIVTFLVTVSKCLLRSNVREEMIFYGSRFERTKVIMVTYVTTDDIVAEEALG